MSHQPLRTENNCLNCGQVVDGRYCSHCGQENIQLNDSLFHLAVHYVQDLFHYEGKFWVTIKTMFLHPGKVAKDYIEGKRRSYLDPIRFYIFSSTIFFLVFFLMIGKPGKEHETEETISTAEQLYHLELIRKSIPVKADTVWVDSLLHSARLHAAKDSLMIPDSLEPKVRLDLFDSMDKTPEEKTWLERVFAERADKKSKELKREFKGNEEKATSAVLDKWLHSLPQLFFLSLPFFALFLQLVYVWSGARPYVSHFIFSIFLYAYIFVLYLLLMLGSWGLDKSGLVLPGPLEDVLVIGFILYPFGYLLFSMKRFYHDRWGKLLLRYFMLLTLSFCCLLILAFLVALVAFLF